MPIALQRLVATRRVGIEPTARVYRDVGCLLDRLDREILGRVDDNSPLATDPGDDRGPVFVVMPPAGLAFLAAPPRSTPSRFGPARLGLAFVPSDVVEVIRFHRACSLAIHLVGHRRIPQPPAPAITGPAMDAQLSGHTPRRTRETEEKRRQNPVRQRPPTLVEQGIGEIVEGALATVTPVAFAAGSVVVIPPRIDIPALTAGTLEGTIFPPQRMDVGLTLVDVEELVDV
jgi:hypothetical protein